MTTSEQIAEIAAACAKAQMELKPAVKDAVNPAFRARYADYAAIVEAARVYAKHGVAVWQDVTLGEAGASVATRLAHTSGQWIEFGPLTVPLSKRDAHGVGSATTYAKRYALSAALGISADEDDDGNEAVATHKEPQHRAASPPAGFVAWKDDLTAAADEGTEKLQEAWRSSRSDLKLYFSDTDNEGWEKLKRRAAAASAKRSVHA